MNFVSSYNQEITLESKNITLLIKREDLLHPIISGNKFRKLKYNLLQAKQENHSRIVTFGGAFSNHIAAVAAAGKEYGYETIGIIRGEELAFEITKNPTLQYAQECGMKFDFVSRATYRLKNENDFIEKLKNKFGAFYLIPEGGTNDLAVKGCEEILTQEDNNFDYICCAVGTGGTISGIINSSKNHQKVLGFPSLKGNFLNDEIRKFSKNSRWELVPEFHFGGYAKVNEELIAFINAFYTQTKIPLDPIYTGKMVFGVLNLIQKNYFPDGSKILLVHTGGLQGTLGINEKLRKKQLTIIQYND